MSNEKWFALYRDAVLETDFDKLLERISTAEKAIAERLSLDGQVSEEERRELQDSMNSLLILKKERTEHTELHRSERSHMPDKFLGVVLRNDPVER